MKENSNPYKYGVQIGNDWIDKGCRWNDHGMQCDKYGHLSQGTNGEGPWYCRDHFAKLMGWA